MSSRVASSWQTSIADLSLILFMVTAAAVSRQPAKGARPVDIPRVEARAADPAGPSPRGEPLAVYLATTGAPPLGTWLARQAGDPRQQMTITARYGPAPGAQARAVEAAAGLLREAGAQGRVARLVIEPGSGPARVELGFDAPSAIPAGNDGTPLARILPDRADRPDIRDKSG